MNKVYIENGELLKEYIANWNGRKYGSLSNFAEHYKLDKSTIHRKLNGDRAIYKKEVDSWCVLLGISEEQKKTTFKGEWK